MNLLSLHAGAATLLAPALRLMLARRVRRGKEIAARLPERWGIEATPRPDGKLLWLHAASVGETVSVLPLLAAFARAAQEASVLMTTGTVTSASLLDRRLPELGLAGRVRHRFVPLDVPAWCGRFLDHWRPDAAAFVESEIWPNLLRGCARRGIPVALVNARMSARSFDRWRRLPGTARALFGGFTLVQAQSPADAARLVELGASEPMLTGNLKYAADPLPVDTAELARLRGMIGDRPSWLAASTHPGEDAVALGVHRRLAAEFPGLLTVIVPRHPERGAAIAAEAGGVAVARRGLGQDPPPGGVWVGDTLGELGLYYRLAGIAFIGKSLGGEAGGQNPLEPARLGCAIATGPEVQNFATIAADLAAAGALSQVADEAALAAWVAGMLSDPARRAAMGTAGLAAASGAAELPGQMAAKLAGLLGRAAMKAPRFWDEGGILPLLLSPLAALYAAATARRLARPGWRVKVPVICCGNASVGGTGKTTLALDLGARLIARGRRPAFLTRGYGGGGGGARQVAVQDDAAEMGDEPLLLAALAPTFAGADRAATARLAVAAGADVLILDDGLQNPTLAKDAALLVIDGEMGFGNGRVIPAGPLREPVANAAARCRAAVLIGPDRRDALAALPAGLPVLRASLRATAEAAEFAGKPVLAFAGIGRPEKFFATLAEAGAVIVARHAFADHHRYTAAELARLHAQAEAAGAIPVTTPKDAVRLPPAERARIRSVGVALDWQDEAPLEALLDTVLRPA